jgi:Arc/MetJ family transcription regulator
MRRRRPGGSATKAAPEEELNAGLPSNTRVAIENWTKQQKDRPSRSEAICRSRLAGSRCYALLLLEPLVVGLGPNVYNIIHQYTRHGMWPMRTNIEIDDVLMRQAQKASGHATKKQTVEEALRLMIRMRRQHEVDAAFGRYRWRGTLARSRTRRGAR